MEDKLYTNGDHIENLLFHKKNDQKNDIVNMDLESRYERLKEILEDPEKQEEYTTIQEYHTRNMLTNTKN